MAYRSSICTNNGPSRNCTYIFIYTFGCHCIYIQWHPLFYKLLHFTRLVAISHLSYSHILACTFRFSHLIFTCLLSTHFKAFYLMCLFVLFGICLISHILYCTFRFSNFSCSQFIFELQHRFFMLTVVRNCGQFYCSFICVCSGVACHIL